VEGAGGRGKEALLFDFFMIWIGPVLVVYVWERDLSSEYFHAVLAT